MRGPDKMCDQKIQVKKFLKSYIRNLIIIYKQFEMTEAYFRETFFFVIYFQIEDRKINLSCSSKIFH